GGSAANTIYGLGKLGVSTGFVGVVGDDTDGQLLLQDLAKVGVDISQIKTRHNAKTGAVLCLSDRQGKRSLYVVPGANSLLTMADVDLTYLNQAKMLHVSSFAGDRQFQLTLGLVEKLDSAVKLSFAPGMLYASKGLKALRLILARTHVLFINGREIEQLTGKDVISGAAVCLNEGCKIVAVTLGKGMELRLRDGKLVTAVCYIRDAESEHTVEPLEETKAVDTTGAGDAFAAGFLYGLVKDKDLEECGRLGNTVARFSITQVGARAGLPTLADLSRRYRQLYSATL
ncbi:MAG: carbohydrate kinase family protein, partial [Chloroflexota bacterium]|nr:carbohydrate kinase family protein [Chloroflexota bacterium]